MGTAMRALAGAIHAEVSRKRRALDIAPAGAPAVPLLTIEGQSLGVGLGTSAGQGVDACANVVELRLRLEPASWRDGHGDGGMTVFLYARRGADGGRPPAASVHPGVGWDALGVHGCPHHPYGREWLGSDVPVPCSVLGRDGRQCEERGGLCGGGAMEVLPRGSTLGGMARDGCYLVCPAPAAAPGLEPHEPWCAGCTPGISDGSYGAPRPPVLFFVPGGGRIKPPFFLEGLVVASVAVSYRHRETGGGFYARSQPTFENICGGACLSSIGAFGDASARGDVLKRSRTAFGVCFELFTIHGNITLRTDRNSSGTISFKGAREVRRIYEVVVDSLGAQFVEACAPTASSAERAIDVQGLEVGPARPAAEAPPLATPTSVAAAMPPGPRNPRRPVAKTAIVTSSTGERSIVRLPQRPRQGAPQPFPTREELAARAAAREAERAGAWALYPGFFSVHMAVVTSCLGKRVSVAAGNSIEYNIVRVLGSGGVCLIPSLDDDSNSVNLRVLDWACVFERADEVCGGRAGRRPAADITGSDNTISITCRGALIVRFSWDPAVGWSDGVEAGVLEACQCLCTVMRGCC